MIRRLLITAAIGIVVAPIANARVDHARHAHTASQLPPHWRTWVRIGRCEMPVAAVPGYRGNRKFGIAWNQTTNWTYNGLGMTELNWTTFRRPSQKHVGVHDASPLEQLWSAERLWAWANKTYPGNGWTAWECSHMIGWTTSNPDDALR